MSELPPRYRAMAERMARVYSYRLPRHIQHDDIRQAALMGLLDGLRRRPGQSGPAFEGYLRLRIRGQMVDEVRRYSGGTRHRRQHMLALEDVNPYWEDTIAGTSPNPEEAASHRIDAEAAWQTPLPTACRRIVERIFGSDDKRADIARDEHVSEPRIHQRMRQAIERMRRRLKDAR